MSPSEERVVDPSRISDVELSQMLKKYGVDVGPINAATRKTYERKLLKLQSSTELQSEGHKMERSSSSNGGHEGLTIMSPSEERVVDPSRISDVELSQMFKKYGVDVGPINAATRKTYERKLLKLQSSTELQSEGHKMEHTFSSNSGQEVSTEIEDVEMVSVADAATSPFQSINNSATSYQPLEESFSSSFISKVDSVSLQNCIAPDADCSVEEVMIRCPATSTVGGASAVKHLSSSHQPNLGAYSFSPRIESRPSLPLQRKVVRPQTEPMLPTASAKKQSKVARPEDRRRSSVRWKLAAAEGVFLLISAYFIYTWARDRFYP